ncbi:hypothetical protein Vadar_016879 [Vaccinium darrowii]|uniref:Uncharacterized protein n=1 Tax=Vaccinium darrowii TaxID=229202 RepID=A0ACB7YMD5_9ERIC|nr:hypothetical protein Vadar_016879 [Vaccinium darrowii]
MVTGGGNEAGGGGRGRGRRRTEQGTWRFNIRRRLGQNRGPLSSCSITSAGDPILRRRRPLRSAKCVRRGMQRNLLLGFFHAIGRQIHHQSSSVVEEELDPFLLVENELSILANRLRSKVVAKVPKLASASEYFFKMGWKESDFDQLQGDAEKPIIGFLSCYWAPNSSLKQLYSGGLEELDPFLLVENELSILANRLCSMAIAEVPKLASAAKYFFKMGVKGKRFRPTVLLLMATALNVHIPGPPSDTVVDDLSEELRERQQRITEITELIHVASLLHDDVLDDADTRRGIGSVNFVMGNKGTRSRMMRTSPNSPSPAPATRSYAGDALSDQPKAYSVGEWIPVHSVVPLDNQGRKLGQKDVVHSLWSSSSCASISYRFACHPFSSAQNLNQFPGNRFCLRNYAQLESHSVAGLLHDDVLDDADTRRGIGSVNFEMGNKSHKDAATWRNRSFPHYDMLLTIFGKDRATGKNAVTAEDVLEEESRNEGSCDTENLGISTEEMKHFSLNKEESTSQGKKRKRADDSLDPFREAAMIIGSKIEEATEKFSEALGVNLATAKKRDKINEELPKLSNLSMIQRHRALLAIAHDHEMTECFLTLKDEEKEPFVKSLLKGEFNL